MNHACLNIFSDRHFVWFSNEFSFALMGLMADLESQRAVAGKFLADFLVCVINFMFDIGFPETLA